MADKLRRTLDYETPRRRRRRRLSVLDASVVGLAFALCTWLIWSSHRLGDDDSKAAIAVAIVGTLYTFIRWRSRWR
jgi:hypothetical protein